MQPKVICPGHGPRGGPEVLDDQQAFFVALVNEVKAFAGEDPSKVQAAVPTIMATLKKTERIKRYVGNFLLAQVEKAFIEEGGKPFPKAEIPGN